MLGHYEEIIVDIWYMPLAVVGGVCTGGGEEAVSS